VRVGIAYVPQDRRMFRGLTVEQNLEVAELPTAEQGAAGRAWTREAVYAFFPALTERRGQLAGRLSGGEQRMLAIARAPVANPALALCDEPTDGLAPVPGRAAVQNARAHRRGRHRDPARRYSVAREPRTRHLGGHRR
jgi:branched-chain amino acid transport system ATP-binding protein